jgi:hypothetical protein
VHLLLPHRDLSRDLQADEETKHKRNPTAFWCVRYEATQIQTAHHAAPDRPLYCTTLFVLLHPRVSHGRRKLLAIVPSLISSYFYLTNLISAAQNFTTRNQANFSAIS